MTGATVHRWHERPIAPVLGAVAGVLAAVTSASIAARGGAPVGGFIVPDVIGGLMFVVAGVAAWRWRPQSLVGPLLVLSAIMWFTGSNAGAPIGALASLGYSFGGFYDLVLAYLALSFPERHPRWTSARLVLGLMAVAFLARSAARLLLNEPSVYYPDFCGGCPENPFRVALNQGLYESVDRIGTAALGLLCLVVLALIVRRWRSSSRAGLRVLGPILVGGAVAMAAATYDHAAEAAGLAFGLNLFPDAEPVRHFVIWALFIGRGLVPLAFLAGVLRLRLGRGAVADLVLDLSEAPPRERLRESLSHALGDPSASVSYWSAGSASFVDEDGLPVDLPFEDPARGVTVLERAGEPLAAIDHDRAVLEDPALVQAVGGAVRMAIENERLRERLEAQLEEIRASRTRIVEKGDEERRRVERNLHDGAQQRLLTLSMALKLARAQAASGTDPELERTLRGADDELRRALQEIRELARGIHPAVLSRSGLGAALRSLAERSAVPVEIVSAPRQRLAAPVEATVYFLVSEALANAAKHARAGLVTVSVTEDGDRVHVEVSDDGIGGARLEGGTGLLGLRDRVAAQGGELFVKSPPEVGTTIAATGSWRTS